MWEWFKELYAGLFLIACAGWLLAHLILIKLLGVVWIAEPNDWILWVEIAMTTGIVALGVERLVKDIREWRRRNDTWLS